MEKDIEKERDKISSDEDEIEETVDLQHNPFTRKLKQEESDIDKLNRLDGFYKKNNGDDKAQTLDDFRQLNLDMIHRTSRYRPMPNYKTVRWLDIEMVLDEARFATFTKAFGKINWAHSLDEADHGQKLKRSRRMEKDIEKEKDKVSSEEDKIEQTVDLLNNPFTISSEEDEIEETVDLLHNPFTRKLTQEESDIDKLNRLDGFYKKNNGDDKAQTLDDFRQLNLDMVHRTSRHRPMPNYKTVRWLDIEMVLDEARFATFTKAFGKINWAHPILDEEDSDPTDEE